MLWVPIGFAHGFRVVSQTTHVLYKTTDFYAPEHERTVAWNDPALEIDWELDGKPIVSAKGSARCAFRASGKIRLMGRQFSWNSTAIAVSTSTALPSKR